MIRLRPMHAIGAALGLVLLAAAGPLLLATDAGSFLHPDAGRGLLARDERPGSSPEAAGGPARYAFTPAPDLDPRRDALVIVSPALGYTDGEVRRLHAFLHLGGRVLLAADGSAGAELLDRLGVGIASTTTRVYTPGFKEDPKFLVAESTGRVPALPREVVMSRPVLVVGGDPVLRTPELAWLDGNDNGRPDLGETLQGGAVAAVTTVGAGVLLVVGDPDLLLRPAGDAAAARALVAFVTESGARTAVVDEAHRVHRDPFSVNGLLAGRGGPLAVTGILMVTGALGALAVLGPRFLAGHRARRVPPSGRPAGADATLVDAALLELAER